MNTQLNEYKDKPVLSDEAKVFVDNFSGQPLPEHIRTELEQFVKNSEPFVEQAGKQLTAQFNKIFKS